MNIASFSEGIVEPYDFLKLPFTLDKPATRHSYIRSYPLMTCSDAGDVIMLPVDLRVMHKK